MDSCSPRLASPHAASGIVDIDNELPVGVLISGTACQRQLSRPVVSYRRWPGSSDRYSTVLPAYRIAEGTS